MASNRCSRGHYYDPDKYSRCPVCPKIGLEILPTRPEFSSPRSTAGVQESPLAKLLRQRETEHSEAAAINASPAVVPPPLPQEGALTVALAKGSLGFDPVVGWLVCIDGPDSGRDFRLHTERNFLGRDPSMDVRLGDEAVSRRKQAVVSFNPKKSTFRIGPGEGRGLVYLNGEELDQPAYITAYDVIEIGKSKLLFIPLCGPRFSWEVHTESRRMPLKDRSDD